MMKSDKLKKLESSKAMSRYTRRSSESSNKSSKSNGSSQPAKVTLTANTLSVVFSFFRCSELLKMRLVSISWSLLISECIGRKATKHPSLLSLADLCENPEQLQELKSQGQSRTEELLNVYGLLNQVTINDIYVVENNATVFQRLFECFHIISQQFNLLSAPRSQTVVSSSTTSFGWKLAHVQAFFSKILLPLRASNGYTLFGFIQLFQHLSQETIQQFRQILSEIHYDFVNLVQFIPVLANRLEKFISAGLDYFETLQRDNPRLVKYVFLTTEIEMEKKEIAISKYFEKKYSLKLKN